MKKLSWSSMNKVRRFSFQHKQDREVRSPGQRTDNGERRGQNGMVTYVVFHVHLKILGC